MNQFETMLEIFENDIKQSDVDEMLSNLIPKGDSTDWIVEVDEQTTTEAKKSVSRSDKDNLKRLSQKVMKIREEIYEENRGRGYFAMERDMQMDFFNNFKDANGKLCSNSMTSKSWSVLTYLMANIQNTENHKTESNLEDCYNGSCYKSMKTIQKELRMRIQTLREAMNLLALNGYLIRKVSNEYSDWDKYYFYVLMIPDKELCMAEDNPIKMK